jgi:hypothetical protein
LLADKVVVVVVVLEAVDSRVFLGSPTVPNPLRNPMDVAVDTSGFAPAVIFLCNEPSGALGSVEEETTAPPFPGHVSGPLFIELLDIPTDVVIAFFVRNPSPSSSFNELTMTHSHCPFKTSVSSTSIVHFTPV